MNRKYQIKVWGKSDVGRRRLHNEDNFLVMEELNLFAVADGMGGHAHGELASKTALKVIADFIAREKEAEDSPLGAAIPTKPKIILSLLRRSVETACRHVYDLAMENREYRGMGTTITVTLFNGEDACVAHVGDSRAYLIRRQVLKQITEDHTLVNEQLKSGLISAEEARVSRHRNIITRSVGFEREVQVDTLTFKIQPGDGFLLCSDGLTGLIEDAEIYETVSNNFFCSVPGVLIERANSLGGHDNITAVMLYVEGGEEA